MGLHGGRWTWVLPSSLATYSADVFDTSPSKVAAAEAAAATALSSTVDVIRLKGDVGGSDPRRDGSQGHSH